MKENFTQIEYWQYKTLYNYTKLRLKVYSLEYELDY